MSIKIKKEKYSYDTIGGYDKDTISTYYTARSIVIIENIIKKFEDDEYLFKAKDWVNKTFAEDEYVQLKNDIEKYRADINKMFDLIDTNNKLLNTFLVPVDIIDETK